MLARSSKLNRLQLLESAVIHARDAIIILEALPSATGRSILYVNDAFTQMTGYTAEEVLGRSLHFLRGPNSDTQTLDRIRVALEEESPLLVELLNYRKDQTEYWVELSLVPVPGEEETLSHWVMIQRDISDRKIAEEQLLHSESLFRGVFENAASGVSILDSDNRFVAVNPAFAKFVGRDTTSLLGQTPEGISHPEDWAEQERLMEEVRTGIRDQFQLLKRYFRPDGEVVWAELSLAFVRDREGKVESGLGVLVDVTERKQLEDQLRQAQKTEAIGKLAGGVAHDFNNILTGIIGNLDLVNLAPTDPNHALVQTASQAAQRAAALTGKLLGFARKNQLVISTIDIRRSVEEVVHLLRHTFDPRITIVIELGTGNSIRADATLINLVIMNLCLNARDAMPDGGTLTIRSDQVSLSGGAVPEREGDFLRLTIADTGIGMCREVTKRLFEPFYTTKPVGQGTGLGLSMVDGIVKQHRGWVEVESEPGLGTRFDVLLPVSYHDTHHTPLPSRSKRMPQAPYTSPNTPPPSSPARTILLVDDEEMIRNLGKIILQGLGYAVIEAADGIDAVEVFRREQHRIDLVVLDLTMPRLSGRDAFRAITAIQPAAKVLFSSGYSADDMSDVTGAVGLLPKPYRPQELGQAVREALENPPH